MEEEGWLESHWGESEKQSARQVLQADRRGTAATGSGNQAWGRIALAITRTLEAS
jgi:hypothetical protein